MLQGATSFASRSVSRSVSRSFWVMFDLALISPFQPPFPRKKPVPFKTFPLKETHQDLAKPLSIVKRPHRLHWGVMSYKVKLICREHSAAMSAVPLGTAISAVIKRSSGAQALLQCLPSAFPL